MRRLLIYICVTVLLFHFVTARTLASESSLTVSPAILEKITAQNQLATASATINNTTNFPLPVKGQVDAFLGNTNLTGLTSNAFNSASWFTLEPADFILQPHESRDILIKIKPPNNTEPGGHYATIFFQPLIPSEVVSPQSTISLARIGVLVFLIVPGDIHENLELSSLTAKTWSAFGPVNFDFTLNNPGNIHLLPLGQLEIRNLFGKVVATLPLPPTTILPGTHPGQTLTWDRSLLFGRYQATLSLSYGSDHTLLTTKPLIFWVVPWPYFLFIFMLLTLLYKIFIVHIDRIKLAINVLKGKNVHAPQNTPSPSHIRTSTRRRTHPTHTRLK